jgi:hypothetical protein
MKALILKIFVVVILIVSFSSFVLLRHNQSNENADTVTTANYQYDYQNGIEDRELR